MSTVEHPADAQPPEPAHHESHHLPPALVANQQKRAVLFFILADAVFFASLLFTYFYLRALDISDGWSPSYTNVAPAWQVWLVTGVIVVSALVYRSAEQGIAAGQRARFLSGTLVGLILVIASIGLMIYQIRTWGILMSDGSYASVFIVMSWVQLVHLFILAFLAIGIWNRGNRGKFDHGNTTHVVLVGYFWYWVVLTSVLGALTTFFVR